jgi:hypothetical protein
MVRHVKKGTKWKCRESNHNYSGIGNSSIATGAVPQVYEGVAATRVAMSGRRNHSDDSTDEDSDHSVGAHVEIVPRKKHPRAASAAGTTQRRRMNEDSDHFAEAHVKIVPRKKHPSAGRRDHSDDDTDSD